MDKFLKMLPMILPLVIALSGVAVSWGAARATLSGTQAEIAELKIDVKETREKVQQAQIEQATVSEALRGIERRLDSIDSKLDDLNRKLK